MNIDVGKLGGSLNINGGSGKNSITLNMSIAKGDPDK